MRMNRLIPITFVALLIAALGSGGPLLRAQDKAATPKATPKSDSPKVLLFKAKPDDASPASDRSSVVARLPAGNPLLDGPAQIIADFFTDLEAGKINEGYARLTKDSKIAEKPEELKTLKAKTVEAIEVFGAIAGYDFVESRSIGSRLLRATYISQGKVFPLRWRFYFYKPEDSWRLIDMRVDDKLTGIFDEIEETKGTDQKGADTGLP